MVQAAVPDQPNADRRAVLFELFSSAIDAAEAFAKQQGVAEDLAEIRQLAGNLA